MAASAVVLAAVVIVLAVWWAASRERRDVSFRVTGTLSAIELDVGEAPVRITGGAGGAVEVQRTEELAFGHHPTVARSVEDGVLRLAARCPSTVIGTCDTSFRIAVPDNVQVNVSTSSGPVTISALNGSARVATQEGAVSIDQFCGFTLVVTSASGDVTAAADCSPDRMELRSGSGDVRAVLPPARYRVEAQNDAGTQIVRGITVADDASFAVQALSGSGDVTVENAP